MSFLTSILTPYLDEFEHRDELLKKIGSIKVNGSGPPITIAKRITEEVADKIQAAIKENRIQGLIFEKSFRRIYPNPLLAAHLVGMRSSRLISENSKEERMVGVSGLEKSVSHYLEGKDGYEITKRDFYSMLSLIHI